VSGANPASGVVDLTWTTGQDEYLQACTCQLCSRIEGFGSQSIPPLFSLVNLAVGRPFWTKFRLWSKDASITRTGEKQNRRTSMKPATAKAALLSGRTQGETLQFSKPRAKPSRKHGQQIRGCY